MLYIVMVSLRVTLDNNIMGSKELWDMKNKFCWAQAEAALFLIAAALVILSELQQFCWAESAHDPGVVQ